MKSSLYYQYLFSSLFSCLLRLKQWRAFNPSSEPDMDTAMDHAEPQIDISQAVNANQNTKVGSTSENHLLIALNPNDHAT